MQKKRKMGIKWSLRQDNVLLMTRDYFGMILLNERKQKYNFNW